MIKKLVTMTLGIVMVSLLATSAQAAPPTPKAGFDVNSYNMTWNSLDAATAKKPNIDKLPHSAFSA